MTFAEILDYRLSHFTWESDANKWEFEHLKEVCSKSKWAARNVAMVEAHDKQINLIASMDGMGDEDRFALMDGDECDIMVDALEMISYVGLDEFDRYLAEQAEQEYEVVSIETIRNEFDPTLTPSKLERLVSRSALEVQTVEDEISHVVIGVEIDPWVKDDIWWDC